MKDISCPKAPESLEKLIESQEFSKVVDSLEKLESTKIVEMANNPNENIKISTTPSFIELDDEITSQTSLKPPAVTSNTIIMKLKTALGGMFPQLIDDVTRPTTENLCAHQNSSDTARLSKNADNEASLSQKECKLSSSHSDASTKTILATSTFTSRDEIFNRTMEMQKRKIEGKNDEEEGVNESPSELSNQSISDISSTEIVRRVVNFDD